MSYDVYTEDIGRFGSRERAMLAEILGHNLPDGFANDNVRPAMNMHSGYVFLVNDEYQVAMMNGDSLELFFTSPYEGLEGFADELADQYDDMNTEDQGWFDDVVGQVAR